MKNTLPPQNLYTQVLERAGFSPKEARIYELLLSDGQMGVNELLKLTEYKRGDLYNVLYTLRDKGALEQTIKGGVIQFKPNDPYQLVQYLNNQKEKFLEASVLLEAVLPQMFAQYNLVEGKPSVRHFAGLEGLVKVYDILNKSGEKEILLFRSTFDNDNPDETGILKNQIKEQVALGIRVRAIVPIEPGFRKDDLRESDKLNLVERRSIPKHRFTLPAQIMVFGNTVAIISMRKNSVATVIDDMDIAQTFRTLFELTWASAQE